MKRVVVTGMGIWSCIGQDLQTVTESLKQGRSGVIFDPNRVAYGLNSGVLGYVPLPKLQLPRRFRATMSTDTQFAYMSTQQALENAHIDDEYLRQNEVGIIWGNDGNSHMVEHDEIIQAEKDAFLLEPSSLFKEETSSPSMNLATVFHLRGINLTISSACASATNAIGVATTMIRQNMQNMIIVGGSYFQSKEFMLQYDATYGLAIDNEHPQKASRPFDVARDGCVPSSGAATLVLEEYEHAVARGATILAEIIGYGAVCGGVEDLSQPYHEGIYRAIKKALADAKIEANEVDMINAAAPSSKLDDREEAIALSKLFANGKTIISCTEALTGHEGWMAGASKAVYSILMMQNSFVAPNINLEQKMDEAQNLIIPNKTVDSDMNIVLNNSIGLGNAYSTIIFKRV